MLNYAGGNPITAYNLQRSLRFRASASAYLNRTFGSGGNRDTWTWSGWVKRGQLGAVQNIFNSYPNGTAYALFQFTSSDTLRFAQTTTGGNLITTQVFRDPSAWYHIVLAYDDTQATAANRVKMYVNGVQVTSFGTSTYPDQNFGGYINGAFPHFIGQDGNSAGYFDGYQAEVNFIGGQALTPSPFGSTNSTTGVWQPAKYTGTYGTNGFYLPFTSNGTADPAGLGKDYSGTSSNAIVGSSTVSSTTLTVVSLTGISVGNIIAGPGIPANTYVVSTGALSVTMSQAATSTNASTTYTFSGNNWFCNNISITAGVTYDSMTDVPTLTSATASNFCVLNPLDTNSNLSITNANLRISSGVGNFYQSVRGTIAIPSTGKFYFECINQAAGTLIAGIDTVTAALPGSATGAVIYDQAGNIQNNGTLTGGYATLTTGDVLAVAVDVTANKIYFYKNNVLQNTGGSTIAISAPYSPLLGVQTAGSAVAINFGQQPFTYTPPTGFVALNAYNLPDSTIKQGNKVMDAALYTGDANLTRTLTGLYNFQPDFIWAKNRSSAFSHVLQDVVRGFGSATKLASDSTAAENTGGQPTDPGFGYISSVNSTGFSVATTGGGITQLNQGTAAYVAWAWKANGAGVTNTSGTITSTVSVNATAGFSVVTYTGTGANATVGHGLGVAPKMIIFKNRSSVTQWCVYHISTGNNQVSYLNLTNQATVDPNAFNNTTPTSSVFTVGTNTAINANAMVAYCWAEIDGFSKFGSYVGTPTLDGPFVYLGFKARFIMFKRADGVGGWVIYDSARNTYNLAALELRAETSGSEITDTNSDQPIDILSNGFKLRGYGSYGNANGSTYIYMAFAENPFRNSLAR